METIRTRFIHPVKKTELVLALPRDTRFSALTAMLYERGFLEPQKPGYRYLYQEHLCGANHALEDYMPAGAGEITLEIFRFPEVLV